jgi:hypothetical protein
VKRLLALLLLFAALAAGWYLASPWLAMKGLRDAAQEMDRAALEERVDFAAIRVNLKGDLRGAVEREVARSDSPLAQLGGGLATGIGGMAVDAAINPEGIAALVVTGRLAGPLVPESMRRGEIEWGVERGGLYAFEAHGTFADGRAGPTLHFARDGLGWDLVDVTLPGSGL